MEPLTENLEATGRQAHLLDYWRVIVQRRGVVYLSTGLIATAVILTTLMTRPVYRATAQLQIERSTPRILPFQDLVAGVNEAGIDFYQTQYRIIQSRSIARRVIGALDLSRNPEFAMPGRASNAEEGARGDGAPADDGATVDLFIRRLSVDPVRNSRLVSVSFEAFDPELAARAANAVADAYIAFTLDTSSTTSESAAHSMVQQTEDLQEDIARSEHALHEYAREKQLVFLGNQQTSAEQDLANLRAEYTRAQTERIAREAAYRALREAEAASIPGVASNQLIQELRSSYAALEKQYAEKSEIFKPGWPALVELRAKKQAARRQLDEQLVQIAARLTDSADVEYREAVRREQGLKEALDGLTRQVQELNLAAIRYYSMKADLESKKKNLEELLERQGQTGISARLGDKSTSNIRIVDRAEVPKFPYKPRRRLSAVIGVLTGLVVGTGLAFFLEYIDNTLKTPGDVERYLHLPTLAVVPTLAGVEPERSSRRRHRQRSQAEAPEPQLDLVAGEGAEPALVRVCRRLRTRIFPVVTGALSGRSAGRWAGGDAEPPPLDLISHVAPRSPHAEAYRELRTSILLSSADAPPVSILVTSTHPGEGKTSTSTNLAISMAQIGHRVLLVDTDMRKPRIHRVFRISNAAGMSNFLSGSGDLQALVQPSDVPGLWLLPSGPVPPNPSDLLESARLHHLLKTAGAPTGFKHIIFDSPPLFSFADASILSTRVDAVILVVWGGRTSRELERHGRDKLVQGRARLIGAVLNNVSLDENDYYRYYRYYKHYYSPSRDADREEAHASDAGLKRPGVGIRLTRTG